MKNVSAAGSKSSECDEPESPQEFPNTHNGSTHVNQLFLYLFMKAIKRNEYVFKRNIPSLIMPSSVSEVSAIFAFT